MHKSFAQAKIVMLIQLHGDTLCPCYTSEHLYYVPVQIHDIILHKTAGFTVFTVGEVKRVGVVMSKDGRRDHVFVVV